MRDSREHLVKHTQSQATKTSETPKDLGGARFWWLLTVSILVSAVGLSLLAVLLLPPLKSVLSAQVAKQGQVVQIGPGAEITLERGWVVQNTIGEGLLLRSPNRQFEVALYEVTASQGEQGLKAALAAARDIDGVGSEMRKEVLLNGSVVRHVDLPTGWVIALEVGTNTVLLEAEIDDTDQLDQYRAEMADLLVRVTPIS